MLKEDKNKKRLARHAKTQEDFTPDNILEIMFEGSESIFTDFSKTFLDPTCGTGNIIIFILNKRLYNCNSQNDYKSALETCYGTELMEDNVNECKERIYKLLTHYNFNITDEIKNIINHNIICTDAFKWDYENWKPIIEPTADKLFESDKEQKTEKEKQILPELKSDSLF